MAETFVVTTPIYYPNSVPHIGTALTTVMADVIARYHRLRGEDVFFLTGTDENGLKLKEAAESAGETPMEFVDRISERFQEIWKGLHVEYDQFIRTTEPRHIRAVQSFFELLQKNGYIYVGKYEGWYDVSTETFYKETDLVDGKSPDGNPVRWVEEENYFFKMSAFQEKLLEHIEQNPTFIQPEARRNEVASFIRQGLRDVCVSRLNPGWGIEVPGDPARVIYVWVDAVINYVTASGWPDPGWEAKWPADVQLMGKDILTRFHATLWPAMLMGVGLPLPKALVGHAWILMGGEKVSKSKGNVVAPLDLAAELAQKSGCKPSIAVDAVRYGIVAATPFEADTTFTLEDFDRRYNSDLANDLGNALNRSLAMSHRFVGGVIPNAPVDDISLGEVARAIPAYVGEMERYRIDKAAAVALDLVRYLNKYVDTQAPWALAKANDPKLAQVMRSILYVLRVAGSAMAPFMPSVSVEVSRQLGFQFSAPFDSWLDPDRIAPVGTVLAQPEAIFPRLELAGGAQSNPVKPAEKQKPNSSDLPEKPKVDHNQKMNTPVQEEISIEEFAKVKLRIARVLEAEAIEGSDKLLKLQLAIGDERRQIVAGVKANYTPEDLIGRQIVVCVNLKPAKLRGVESQGMLLAATDSDGSAILLTPDRETPEGAPIK